MVMVQRLMGIPILNVFGSINDTREQTTLGGGQTGLTPRYSHYTVNELNQYTRRTVPGYTAVMGTAHEDATVSLLDSARNTAGRQRKQGGDHNNARPWHEYSNAVLRWHPEKPDRNRGDAMSVFRG